MILIMILIMILTMIGQYFESVKQSLNNKDVENKQNRKF